MNVEKVEAEPVKPPPPTYSITGLTEEEMTFLRELVFCVADGVDLNYLSGEKETHVREGQKLHQAIWKAQYGSTYTSYGPYGG